MLPAEALGVAIRWITTDAAVRQTASEITAATRRIHDLVSAVKGFTFMDREGVPDEVDIARQPAIIPPVCLERRHGVPPSLIVHFDNEKIILLADK